MELVASGALPRLMMAASICIMAFGSWALVAARRWMELQRPAESGSIQSSLFPLKG